MTRCNTTCEDFVLQFDSAWLKLRLLGATALALLAAACGGGGGSAAPVIPAPAPVVPQPVIAGCTLLYPVAGGTARNGLADPLLGNQWHLNAADETSGTAGLGVTAIASSARGRGVRVAIIDGPIEALHDDLAASVDTSASYDYRRATAGAPLPCTAQDDHGTAVAGIIAAARDNGLGGAGVAPAATLVAYNAIERDAPTALTQTRIADALRRDASRNQVYHNSWGSPDDGALHAADAAVTAAIEANVSDGRGGRGALVVFAAGNGGCLAVDGTATADPADPSRCRYRDMTGFDGHLNIPGTITACAVDRQGRLPLWGEEGENLLVCGLSSGSTGSDAITTTALRNDYRSNFGGASAAAPMVSGVIALMLEANPALSWRDVRLILAETARETLPADASWKATRLARWPAQAAGGGGLVTQRFSRKFGYGVVDAAAAVERARHLAQSVGASSTLKSCERIAQGPIALSDPVGGVIQWASDTAVFKADDDRLHPAARGLVLGWVTKGCGRQPQGRAGLARLRDAVRHVTVDGLPRPAAARRARRLCAEPRSPVLAPHWLVALRLCVFQEGTVLQEWRMVCARNEPPEQAARRPPDPGTSRAL